MSEPTGFIIIEYQGMLCPELADYLSESDVRIVAGPPLVIRVSRPERLLTSILMFLADPAMRVTRIRVSGKPLSLIVAGVA